MIDEALEELQQANTKAHESLVRELGRLRAGRANPDLIAGIRVDYYGTPTPLGQVANIAVPEPRLLTVKPWEKNMVKTIEKAIVEAGLDLNPQTDGDLIRVPMPTLTEDRRKGLVKMAKKAGEDAKVVVRKARHEAKDVLDALQKDGDASEDECDRARKKLEEIVQAAQTHIDTTVGNKEKDILEV